MREMSRGRLIRRGPLLEEVRYKSRKYCMCRIHTKNVDSPKNFPFENYLLYGNYEIIYVLYRTFRSHLCVFSREICNRYSLRLSVL